MENFLKKTFKENSNLQLYIIYYISTVAPGSQPV